MTKKYLIGLGILSLLLTSCNEKNKTAKSVEKSKTVTVSLGSKPKSLDPAMYNEIPSLSIVEQIYNTLFQIDSNGNIVPELAESFEYITPTNLVIKIKKGVKFHNGEELKANDVLFSLNRMLQKPATQVMLNTIEKVDVIDDYTVNLKLKEPSAPLLYSLSYPMTAILNEKFTTEKNGNIATDAMGTGAFKYQNWGDGEKIELTTNKDYFGEKAKIDELIFRAIPENTSRLAALETGEIDIATIAPIDVQTVEGSSDLYAVSFSTTSTEYLTLNNLREPFTNKDFRKALSYAIDRQSIVDAVYLGKASIAKSIVNPTVFGSDQTVGTADYNLEKAKEYLEKSQVTNKTIKIMSNDNPIRLQAAQIVQANLKEIGINAEIETVEWGTYLQMTAKGDFDIFIGGWVSGTSDSDIVLFPLLHSSYKGGAGNRANFDNPEYDKLVELGRTSTDSSDRLVAYSKAQEILAEETPIVPLYYKNENMGLNKRIKDFTPMPNTIHNYAAISVQD
ncbi:ABC transporter substrate-binding protein [Candidatus Cetobacterium colombiensis]|uniref:ABC transporter substrate-binding protein n=1 Tax=Candidatus Cetobacterium colombiensis TaxID=3073100 RepID=A0ABU4WDH7_9FUSO|nr:ABC transporter substrate-binding protein [Candidatus Cetobacterium colombiensis]MDX8336636.1 ABC transporter substrate-binding protein [Candidatus Cetobacterium colombiensis]